MMLINHFEIKFIVITQQGIHYLRILLVGDEGGNVSIAGYAAVIQETKSETPFATELRLT